MESMELRAPDGARLAGSFFRAASPDAVVVVAPALAVAQRHYRRLAERLAARGLSALTFDYRGVGESRRGSLVGDPTTLRQWGEDDLAAALDAAEVRAGGRPVVLLGHSFGGQALGLAPVAGRLAGALTVGAQLGWTGHFPLAQRAAMTLGFGWVVPAVTAAWGYTPGFLGLGADLPGGVVLEWGRWLRSPRYLLDHVPESDRAFAELDFPVRVVAVADDGYAPEAAVAALAATMPTATLARWEPAAWGLSEIGHFGLLRQPALWDHAAEALRGLAGVGRSTAARVA
jgi:predicted alpha/beta hydrolase